jgi:hypothetical protein
MREKIEQSKQPVRSADPGSQQARPAYTARGPLALHDDPGTDRCPACLAGRALQGAEGAAGPDQAVRQQQADQLILQTGTVEPQGASLRPAHALQLWEDFCLYPASTKPTNAAATDRMPLRLFSPIAMAYVTVAQYFGAVKYGAWDCRAVICRAPHEDFLHRWADQIKQARTLFCEAGVIIVVGQT